MLFSGIWHSVLWQKCTDISVELAADIIYIETFLEMGVHSYQNTWSFILEDSSHNLHIWTLCINHMCEIVSIQKFFISMQNVLLIEIVIHILTLHYSMWIWWFPVSIITTNKLYICSSQQVSEIHSTCENMINYHNSCKVDETVNKV